MSVRNAFGSGFLRARLTGLVVGGVMVAVIALGAAAIVAFDRAVEPELENRTRLIGVIVRSEIQQALELGIPIDAITGLERHLGETLEKFGEVERIAVRLASGEILAVADRTWTGLLPMRRPPDEGILIGRKSFTLAILAGNELAGEIVVDTNPRFIQTRLREVFLDVLIVALVAIVVALELVQAVTANTVSKPLDRILRLLGEQREGNFLHSVPPGGIGGLGRATARFNDHAADLAGRFAELPPRSRDSVAVVTGLRIAMPRPQGLRLSDIGDIRLPLFLFSLGTEVATAFLPLYALAAQRPSWLTAEFAAAMPLLFYLAGIAAVSPFAGALARKFGPRRLFLAAVPPTAVALVGMGLSDSVVAITLWRVLLAMCYALATIACQEYGMRAAPERGAAGPIGVSVAVIFGGVFCGSALGGLLAERFGFTAAFATGAAIALLAGVLGLTAMRGSAGDADPGELGLVPSVGASTAPARSQGRLLVLLLGIAVPMNATTAIVVWYLTPLLLADLGSGPAEIARVVMLYYLAVVVAGSTVSRLSDNRTGPVPLVICGALLSAAALMSLSAWGELWPAVGALAGLGVGHSMIRAPLYSLVFRLSGGSPRILAALRLVERVGSLLGLILSAALLGNTGIEGSIGTVGAVVLSGAVFYAVSELRERGR